MSETPPAPQGDRMNSLFHVLIRKSASAPTLFAHRVARRTALLIVAAIGLALLLSACDLIDNEDDEADSEQAQQEEMQEQSSAGTTAEAAVEPARSAASVTPATLDATDVYAIIRTGLALVETELGTANGVVTRDGRIITDGVVVDGAASIAVGLSNGDRIEDVAVQAVDPISGLASIGPISGSLARRLPAVVLGDGERLPIGSDVYVIGFSTAGAAAGASIGAGLLSRSAEWTAAELTIFSTDASIPRDQAGLILADANGAVIGIATQALAWRGLFVSASDLARQIAELPAAGEMADGEVTMAMEAAITEVEVMPGEQALAFMTMADAGPRLSLTVTGDQRGMVTVLDATGATIDTATVVGGGADTVIVSELSTTGPYQIWLSSESAEGAVYAVQSEQMVADGMMAMDFDDRPWNLEDANSLGVINPSEDVDVFSLQVRPGDVYEVRVESLIVDVYLYATGGGLDLTDDDGLGGVSGTDAMLRLEPTAAGELQLVVGSIGGEGGYLISVEQLEMGSDEVMAAAEPPAMMESFPPFPDPPIIAMRGVGDQASLVTTAVSRGFDAGDGMLMTPDADGSFDITATILGTSGATARILVSDAASGDLVFQSTLTATCAGAESCMATLISNPFEAAGGEWIVTIEHGATGAISQWQVAVATND